MSGRSRSGLVLLGGAAVAVALGAVAALLRPAPAPVPGSPTNLALPIPADAEVPEARRVHQRMLAELIEDSATAERPDRLPSFSTFVLLVARDPEQFGWVVDRLTEPGVPTALLLDFAGHLPTRDRRLDATVRRLLLPLLEGDDTVGARAALDVLRAGGRTRVATYATCRCAFGHYPARPVEGRPVWLFAFPLEADEAIAWEPQPRTAGTDGEAGWVLGMRSDPDGRGLLVREVPAAPAGAWVIEAADGAPARLDVGPGASGGGDEARSGGG